MNFFKQWVPIFEWLPSYQKADLRGDAIAGITVAMMLIPQAMSYALFMSPGGYRNADYIRAGGIMTFIFLALAVGAVWLLFV